MQNKKKLYFIISIVSFLIVLIALLAIGVLLFSYKQSRDDYAQLAQEARTEATTMQTAITETTEQPLPTVPLAEIPINFDYLKEQNEDIIGWISQPSMQLSQQLMESADLILATGGPGMVKAAYSSGKPALGVGPGNVPAVIDCTADI